MRTYSFSHLSDPDLRRFLFAMASRKRTTTAVLVAVIAEYAARRLYAPDGYPSMRAFCVAELELSKDSAHKHIRAARTARQYPEIFHALSDGRLSLSVVVLLASYLTPGNADELLNAAARKPRAEVEELLARKFPRTEPLAMIAAIPSSVLAPHSGNQLVAGQGDGQDSDLGNQVAPGPPPARRTKLAPLSEDRYEVNFAISKSTKAKLEYAQSLLGQRVVPGDIAGVLDLALDALNVQLEKKKLGAATRPRPASQSTTKGRYVPLGVRYAVWERDQRQCTFVSEGGRRCGAREFLEFDHIEPVARGGRATVENIRLRCRAHNQYEAERVFGAEFMEEKRCAAAAAPRSRAAEEGQAGDVFRGLRELGFRANEATRGVELTEALGSVALEERMRAALKFLVRRPAARVEIGGAWMSA